MAHETLMHVELRPCLITSQHFHGQHHHDDSIIHSDSIPNQSETLTLAICDMSGRIRQGIYPLDQVGSSLPCCTVPATHDGAWLGKPDVKLFILRWHEVGC